MYIGKFGSITLLDSQGQAKGFIGVETEPFKVVSAIANNGSGLIRLTVTGHGWDQGDNILVFLLGGNANGDWMINVVDANHVDLRDSTFTGGYTTPGQAYRYYGPFWGQAIAGGGTGYADAAFRVFSAMAVCASGHRPARGLSSTLRLEPSRLSMRRDPQDLHGGRVHQYR
jgi:hypothetical protein